MRKSACDSAVATLFHACLWLAAATPAAAQTIKLNGPFVEPVLGRVGSVLYGKQRDRVVYYASQEVPGFMQLYSVPADRSSAPIRLSPDGEFVLNLNQLSEDGEQVAFLIGGTLFVAPTDGSQPALELASALQFDVLDGLDVRFSPNRQWIVYLEDLESLTLTSVPTDAHQPAAPLSVGGGYLFEISSDSARVAYNEAGKLFSCEIDGNAAATQLTTAPSGTVWALRITPDASLVVYRADHDVSGRDEIYQVAIDGSSSPVKLSGTIVAGGDVIDFEPTSDSTRVVYRADRETDERFELYGAPIDGSSSPVKLSGTMVAGGDVTGFLLTPDGQGVVFRADRETDETFELYFVPAAGGVAPVRLHHQLPAGGDVLPHYTIGITPSSHVLYRADQLQDETIELFATSLAGLPGGTPQSTRLNAPLGPGADVSGGPFGLQPLSLDGQTVLYTTSLLADGRSGTFAVPLLGGPSVGLSPVLAQGGSADYFLPGPDNRAIYFADPDGISGTNAYSIPLDGSEAATVLNDPLPTGGIGQAVHAFRVTPNGEAVYLADQERHQAYELYRVSVLGGEPVKLNAPLVFGGSVGGYLSPPSEEFFALSPDGTRFAYIADQDTPNQIELYGGPLDGSSPPVRLNAAFGPVGQVAEGIRFSPDGSRVVYRAYLDSAGKAELFSVPADASAAPAKLNSALVAGGDVQPDFEIGTDGVRVVYRADGGTDEKFEVYSAPLDGVGLRKRLNPFLALDRDVTAFDLAPGNARVLYLSDQGVNDRIDLYSVPTDGSSAAVRLNDPVGADRDVRAFLASPDGSRVAYTADQSADEVYELYVVPITGGTPVQLNDPLVAGGDVGSIGLLGAKFSPDGTRVVYLADQDVDQKFELYSVPVDASAPAVKVSGFMLAGGGVTEFEITPNSASVVFVGNLDLVKPKLWIAPLSGATAPRELSAPPDGRTVDSFVLDGIGRHAVYLTHLGNDLGDKEVFRTKLLGAPEPQAVTSGISDVEDYELVPFPSATQPLVLYRTFELFSSPLPKKHGAKPF